MTFYSVEVYTSVGPEDVDIVVYDGYLYLGECSRWAAEGIRELLTPEYLVVAALLTVDLVTTWLAGISCEGNPIVLWVWTHIGFWIYIPIKFLLLPLMAFIWHWLGTIPFSPRTHKILRTILVAEAVVPLGTVCLWNICWLLN